MTISNDMYETKFLEGGTFKRLHKVGMIPNLPGVVSLEKASVPISTSIPVSGLGKFGKGQGSSLLISFRTLSRQLHSLLLGQARPRSSVSGKPSHPSLHRRSQTEVPSFTNLFLVCVVLAVHPSQVKAFFFTVKLLLIIFCFVEKILYRIHECHSSGLRRGLHLGDTLLPRPAAEDFMFCGLWTDFFVLGFPVH